MIYWIELNPWNNAGASNDGTITLNKEGKVDVIFHGAVDNVPCDGSVSLDVAPPKAKPDDGKLGDVNFDGKVVAADASLVLVEYANISAGNGQFTDKQKAAGDVDSDGKITAKDATLILRYYAFLQQGNAVDMRDWLKNQG